MSEKNKLKSIQRLEYIVSSQVKPVELRYKTGHSETVYLDDIYEDVDGTIKLLYSRQPLSEDFLGYGSKVEPRDILPSVALYELGYVKLEDGEKISLMPFQIPEQK